jgi:hypothetical protein
MDSSGGHENPLLIICDFNVRAMALLPPEAYEPLIIEINAVLADSICRKSLQAVFRRYSKAQKRFCFSQVLYHR